MRQRVRAIEGHPNLSLWKRRVTWCSTYHFLLPDQWWTRTVFQNREDRTRGFVVNVTCCFHTDFFPLLSCFTSVISAILSIAIQSLSCRHHSFCLSPLHICVCSCLILILPSVHLFPLLISTFLFYPHTHFSPSIHLAVSFSQVAEQISG